MAPCKSTAEEVSFEWSHHSISSTDSKVRTTRHVFIINSGMKRLQSTQLFIDWVIFFVSFCVNFTDYHICILYLIILNHVYESTPTPSPPPFSANLVLTSCFESVGRELSRVEQYGLVFLISLPLFILASAGSTVFWIIGK